MSVPEVARQFKNLEERLSTPETKFFDIEHCQR